MRMLQGIADRLFEPLFSPIFGTPEENSILTGAILLEDGSTLLAEDGSGLIVE